MGSPTVSVIMSVYNCAATLDEALASILDQTFTDWELVVCDDASTDGTGEILRRVAASSGTRITVLTNDTNRRLAYSLNRCLDEAGGELIARMDGDDISEPDRLERQVGFLNEHPDVDLVGTTMRRFSTRGEGDIVRPASRTPDRATMARTSRVPFCHATIVARRAVFERVEGYTVSWRTERGQDLDLWFKFFAAGLVGRNLADPLYRVREDEYAVRRRTPRARFGTFVTRMCGNRALGYGPRAYVVAATDLLKIVVPYRVLDWRRERAGRRASGAARAVPDGR